MFYEIYLNLPVCYECVSPFSCYVGLEGSEAKLFKLFRDPPSLYSALLSAKYGIDSSSFDGELIDAAPPAIEGDSYPEVFFLLFSSS